MRGVSKAIQCYGRFVAITSRLPRRISQGEMGVGEKFSSLRLHTVAMAVAATRMLYRGAVGFDAMRCSALVD